MLSDIGFTSFFLYSTCFNLSKFCESLRVLDLSSCPQITDNACVALR